MSPEQARGAIDEVGPSSDVYSLGATLYEILTGQVAFPGKSTAEVLRRVVAGEFPSPRSVLRSIPAPLEAICLKAMALERRGRYDTVRELAVDLQHWLADEPVVAYPEGRLERLWRWQRQHRTWTHAAAAALIGITVAATVGVVVVERGRRREADARALAETNFNLARRAVEDYLTRVSEDTLLKEQESVDIRRLRGELLKTALGYYRDFLRQRSGDPELRGEVADAQLRVGRILREIGSPDESVAAFRASIALCEERLVDEPADPSARLQLARASLGLGEQLAQVRDFAPAFDALRRSRAVLSGLIAEGRGDATTRVSLADCEKELGIAEAEAGELDRGLADLTDAESILKGLLSGTPGDVGYRTRLAFTINGVGFIHAEKGRDAEALRAFREFHEISRELLGDDPSGHRPATLLDSLALSYFNMGSILYRRGEGLPKVLDSLEKALEYRSELAEAHPSVNDYREKLAISLAEVVQFRHQAGRDASAFEAAGKSIAILEKLVASQPDQPRYRAELGRSLNLLGYLLDEGGDNARALPVLERAAREATLAADQSPETDRYKTYLADTLSNLGEQYADLGRPDEGLPSFRRAVKVRRGLLGRRPGDRQRTLDLADQLEMLARFERHAGHPADAGLAFAEAEDFLRRLDPTAADSAVQGRRGVLLLGQGRAAADQGHDALALPLLRRAVDVLKPFGAAATDDPRPRQRLTEAFWEAARVLRRTGHPGEAELLDAERRALWERRPPADLAAMAIEGASRAATVGYGRLPADDRVEAVRRLDLDLAAENLRMAVSLGFRDPSALLRARDGALLLARPDVRRLMADIAFPENPLVPDPESK